MNNNSSLATTDNNSGMQLLNQPKTVIGENADMLNTILLDNIKRLQTSPDFLAQAKEIREQVREVVNIAKVQVEMFKLSKAEIK